MKILLNASIGVYYNNGKYYNNSMSNFVPIYKQFCDKLVCLCTVKESITVPEMCINAENVEFVNVSKINSIKSLLFQQKQNRLVVQNYVKNCDACIVHIPSTTGNQVIKYAKKYSKPYMVVVVGCVWDSLWNYDIRGKIMAPFYYMKQKLSAKNASHAIYVTNQFLQTRYPSNGVSVCCSDVKLPKISEEVLTQKLNHFECEDRDRPMILSTLASVEVRYKGQEYVIKSIAKLNKSGANFEYHLAGGGNNERLHKLAISLGVEDKVKFYGILPHDRVVEILDITDVYIQPSKQEGLPRAVIEAMSRACPVIGSNIAGIPELLESECLFKPGDVNGICKILSNLDNVKLKHYAKLNYENSKEYDSTELEVKRNLFIKEFIKTI